jgi:AcrR family transcriptional regulator
MPRKPSLNPRKQPQQERSRLTVEAILEATTQVLTEQGYDSTTTNRIAERAGISIGSLYQYFPNKDSLMAALMEQHSTEIADLVEAKLREVAHAPLEIAVPELVKAVIAAHAINPRLHQVLNEEIPRSQRLPQMQQTDARITALMRAYLTHWHEACSGQVHPCLQPQNLDRTIFILSRTVESLCHAAVIEHPAFVGDRQFEQEVADLLLAYLTRNANKSLL